VDALVREESGRPQIYSHESSDRPYRLIVEQMGEGAATLSPEGRILFANQRLAGLLGRERTALIGVAVADLVTTERQNDLEALLAVGAGETLRLPLDLQRCDGRAVPMLAAMSRLEIDGEAVRCLIASDLSRIQEAEQALRESELSFRMLALNSQDGILILQWESGQITLANPYLCRLLQREAESLIGRRLWDIGAFADRPRSEELFEELKVRGSVRYEDLPLISATGEVLEVEFVSNVYLVGEQRMIQCNIRDISDRKAAQRLAQERQAEVLQSLEDMVAALVSLSESRDPYTAGHQSRVAHLAAAIAAELGLDVDQREGLRISGLVHDIGKFSIPAELLTKPTVLKPEEITLLRTHVRAGYDVLAPIHFRWPVAEAVLQHHERLDGSGYPQGLSGDAISLGGRILAVADTVEAMATHRPYRFASGIEKALQVIDAGRGTLYDAAVVDACLRLFRVHGYTLQSPNL
jgi:PAS domain S-box-containing protein